LGYAPLAVAASFGRLDAVEMLLDRGAAVDSAYSVLGTPLTMALRRGHAEIARALLRRGADVHSRNGGFDPLSAAVSSDDMECVNLALAAGANPRSGGRRYNLLTLPAQTCNLELMRRLLEAGVDPNLPDSDGSTALIGAIECDSTESARLLLQRGADPLRAAPNGCTPRDLARLRNCPQMLDLLDEYEPAARQRLTSRSTSNALGAPSGEPDR
jgi:ankyrin repeat protein